MNYLKINADHPEPEKLQDAVRYLKNSGVVAHGTETVYGLTAQWNDWEAIQKLSHIKRRSLKQPYSVMVDAVDDILHLSGWNSPLLQKLLEQVFPGPITILLPRKRHFQLEYWNQFQDIGFRLPDHRLSRELVRETGIPLLTTSANLSGEPSPASAQEISEEITNSVDLVVDSGVCPFKVASTIISIDVDKRDFKIIRAGAVSTEQFNQIFKTIW
jgi:L-threonylcarbamoyladenylate synthase